jgi:hypothetical protein
MQFPLDPHGVYRVSLPDDTSPRARLCIAPRLVGRSKKELSFFDSIRERVVEGRFIKDARAPGDAAVFQLTDGARLFIEPLTLPRWREIKDLIDGKPDFASEGELRDFYLRLAGAVE